MSITSFAFYTFSFPLILVLKLLAFSYIILVTSSGFFPGAILCTLNNSLTISTVPSYYHSTVFSLNMTKPLSDSVRLPIGTVPVHPTLLDKAPHAFVLVSDDLFGTSRPASLDTITLIGAL